MSEKQKGFGSLIWIFVVVMEAVCMIILSVSIFFVKTRHHTSYSDYETQETKQAVTLCSVTSIMKLSKKDMLAKRVAQHMAGDYQYFLCSIEVENESDAAVDYLSIDAMDQNSNYLSCFPIDYYQDIKTANEDAETEDCYGTMVIPEYSTSQYDVILAVEEEQLKDMETLVFFEWTFEDTDEDVISEVSCKWEDVFTPSPVQ